MGIDPRRQVNPRARRIGKGRLRVVQSSAMYAPRVQWLSSCLSHLSAKAFTGRRTQYQPYKMEHR